MEIKHNKRVTTFPAQKIASNKKNKNWYIKNAEFAKSLIYGGGLKQMFENKQENFDLRENRININNFKKYIDLDDIGLDKLPSQFKHVGIGNSKINLLVGEYIKRKKDFKAFLSANDKEGSSSKEKDIKKKFEKFIIDKITRESINQEELEKEIKAFQKYIKYDYQDILEITANKILKKEYKEQFLAFLFEEEFEDLLVSAEQMVYIDVLAGKPVIRRVDPRNMYTWGSGDSKKIEDAEIIVEFGYSGPGKLLDDYNDELSSADITKIEKYSEGSQGSYGYGGDQSVFDRYGPQGPDGVQIVPGSQIKSQHSFGATVNDQGLIRIMRVSWKGKRKVQYIKWYEDGEAMYDYRNENYILDDVVGEELVAVRWISEWHKIAVIGEDIYVKGEVIPFQGRSIVNPSLVTPNYIGTVGATSLTDISKPLDYAYDILWWKREIALATHKGSAALINASMIPSGWEAEDWIKYLTVNKLGFLDPTNEILKGPSQGKSAGAFNTLTGTTIDLSGDGKEIQMYNDQLFHIEQTMGRITGVSAGREGAIGSNEAVGNVEREINQSSHITEKWFSIQNNFVKRVLKKYLEACQFAYKTNPQNGAYMLDDMGQVFLDQIDEFPSAEFDLHLSDSTSDAQLFADLKQLAHAAIQNGNAELSDIIDMYQSESVQELSRKLKNSAEELRERNEKMQMEQNEVAKQAQQLDAQDKKEARDWEVQKHQDEMALKREELDFKREELYTNVGQKDIDSSRKLDSNSNGVDDGLERSKNELERQKVISDNEIKRDTLKENVRHNKAQEAIDRKKNVPNSNNTK